MKSKKPVRIIFSIKKLREDFEKNRINTSYPKDDRTFNKFITLVRSGKYKDAANVLFELRYEQFDSILKEIDKKDPDNACNIALILSTIEYTTFVDNFFLRFSTKAAIAQLSKSYSLAKRALCEQDFKEAKHIVEEQLIKMVKQEEMKVKKQNFKIVLKS